MKRLNDYKDKFGLITYKADDGTMDGGDTCFNEFLLLYCAYHLPNYIKDGMFDRALFVLPQIMGRTKNPVRHPDTSKWYGFENRFSRDQLTPLLHFLALPSCNLPQTKFADKHIAKCFWKLFKTHAKHLFLCTWNTRRNFQYPTAEEHALKSTPDVAWNYGWKVPDFTGPSIWSVWARGLLNRTSFIPAKLLLGLVLWPMLCVWDVENLLGAIHKGHFSKQDNHGNNALSIHFAYKYWPTPISILAKWVYGTKAPLRAFYSFWGSKKQEPPIDTYMSMLYNKQI